LKLQHTSTLAADLSGKHILLDTTVLINASKSDEFLALLSELSSAGCGLVTIAPVVYEFTRNANSITGYNERQEFIKTLNIAVLPRVEEMVEKEPVFRIAYAAAFSAKGDRGPSYTDALLCSVAYKYRANGMLIMTANHKDIPLSMFDRTELISIDISGDLRTEAIYRLSATKLNKIIEKL
jgi:predicted nucleic acid-binding protein